MLSHRFCAAWVALLVAIPAAVARSVELAPGQWAGPREMYYEGPGAADELVASRLGTFEFTGEDEPGGTPRLFRGGYNHQVYRNRLDGTLAFRFGASGADADRRVVDLEGMTAGGFGGFLTDVQITGQRFVQRSADGDTIGTQYSDSVSVGMFVRTDATEFAEGGKLTYDISFQPTSSGGSGVFETFRPVPEPGGLAALGVAAVIVLRHRVGRTPFGGRTKGDIQNVPFAFAALSRRRFMGRRRMARSCHTRGSGRAWRGGRSRRRDTPRAVDAIVDDDGACAEGRSAPEECRA
jgi:hypothetical protein